MSSSYYLLCLSHDPAFRIMEIDPKSEISSYDDLPELHPNCDLLTVRVSGAPIEFGCLGRLVTGSCRGHEEANWVKADWLRILAIAQDARAEEVRRIRERPDLRCWDFGRIYRLRNYLEL
jgi:hypothetical protein